MKRVAAVGLVVAAVLAGCSGDEAGGCRALALVDQVGEMGAFTFVAEADGSVRPFSTVDGLFEPSVTPDGRWVAATRADEDLETSDLLATTVVVLNADGEERATVSGERGTEDAEPALSPDGSHVAFVRVSEDGGGSRVLVADVDGGEPTVRYDGGEVRLRATSWSPDGRYLAVVRTPYGDDDDELLVIEVDSGDEVVAVPWVGASTAWSAGSDRVLGGGSALRELTLDDGELNDLLAPEGVGWQEATYRADGAIVALTDGDADGATERLDIVDDAGRTHGSIQLDGPVGSFSASRCFRPEA